MHSEYTTKGPGFVRKYYVSLSNENQTGTNNSTPSIAYKWLDLIISGSDRTCLIFLFLWHCMDNRWQNECLFRFSKCDKEPAHNGNKLLICVFILRPGERSMLCTHSARKPNKDICEFVKLTALKIIWNKILKILINYVCYICTHT